MQNKGFIARMLGARPCSLCWLRGGSCVALQAEGTTCSAWQIRPLLLIHCAGNCSGCTSMSAGVSIALPVVNKTPSQTVRRCAYHNCKHGCCCPPNYPATSTRMHACHHFDHCHPLWELEHPVLITVAVAVIVTVTWFRT